MHVGIVAHCTLLFLAFVYSQKNLEELKEHVVAGCQEPDHKHYEKLTLGYITPWNKNGFDMAMRYAAKFNFISPAWFEIKPEDLQGKFNVKIEGANYIRTDFIKEIKDKNPNIKILPRFECSQFSKDHYEQWLTEENSSQFLKILMRRMKYNKFDGIVLECNHIWILEQAYSKFAMFIKNLHESFKKEGMILVITLFPYTESFVNVITKMRFEYLSKYTDYFNIMTYDYMSYRGKNADPSKTFNAPLTWITQTLEYYVDLSKSNKADLLKKVLIGLPFHGYAIKPDEKEVKGSLLDGNTYSSIIHSGLGSKFSWDTQECEHLLEVEQKEGKLLAAYPTKKFFSERLKLTQTQDLGGVAIWDLANGLESFLDEF